MKKDLRTVWTAICAAITAAWGTVGAFAAEQGAEPLSRAARANQIMDVIQKVSLWILIVAVALFVCWYAVKVILKKIHVPPEQKEEDANDKDNQV